MFKYGYVREGPQHHMEQTGREVSIMGETQGRTRTGLIVVITVLIILLILFLTMLYPQIFSLSQSRMTLYAYGDSNTVADFPAELMASDGSDSYAVQYSEIDGNCNCSHNLDGGGMTSRWGVENIAAHSPESYDYFIIAFGVNDIRDDVPPEETAQNLNEMAAYVQSKGSTPLVLIPPLVPPDWQPYDTQRLFIQTIEDELTAHNHTFVRGYDAVDTVPFNKQMDEYDPGYYNPDGVHLNRSGHLKIAELLHETINNLEGMGDIFGSVQKGGLFRHRSRIQENSNGVVFRPGCVVFIGS